MYLRSASHKVSTWRGTQGWRIVILQLHSIIGQTIEEGRGNLVVMVTDVIPAKVVHDNQ